MGIHRVPEGHVAVYYRGGALLNHTTSPGFHYHLPLLTTAKFVQTTVQTDKVTNIPCGTAGGTLIHFDRIEVVNQLREDMVLGTVRNYTVDYDKTWIYDKIHHEVNQICSRSTLQEIYQSKFDTLDETLRDALQLDIDLYAPGIKIIAIRVTKPKIPEAVRRQYEQVEEQITRLRVATEEQKLIEKQAETERKRTLKQKETEQQVAEIANAMHADRARAEADAELYRSAKEAEANKMRLTPELLQLEAVRALSNNTKIFWGESLPSLYADGARLLGAEGMPAASG